MIVLLYLMPRNMCVFLPQRKDASRVAWWKGCGPVCLPVFTFLSLSLSLIPTSRSKGLTA